MHKEPSSPQAEKLKMLKEMLEITEKLREDPLSLKQEEAEAFKDKVNSLIAKIQRLDEDRSPCDEDKSLQCMIKETIQRLMEANLSLVASVNAQHEIIGDKIARLRKNRDLLRTYSPKVEPAPALVDSDA